MCSDIASAYLHVDYMSRMLTNAPRDGRRNRIAKPVTVTKTDLVRVWLREENVVGPCIVGLIPGGRVPEEQFRRGGAAVCRSVTALPACRALAVVLTCSTRRTATLLFRVAGTSYVYLPLWYTWQVPSINLWRDLPHFQTSVALLYCGLWPFMCKILESDSQSRIVIVKDFIGDAAEEATALINSGSYLF